MAEPIFQRLHPLTMVVELQRFVRQFIFLIGYGLFVLVTGQGGEQVGFELIGLGIGALVILPAVFKYYSYGYSITDGKLLVKSGIIQKNLRTIPLDRIQNINVKRDWLHRLLGLVVLEIETAAGAQAEATISSLSEEQGHVLQAQLLGQQARSYSRIKREDEAVRVIYRPTSWELFLVGASENRAGAIVAAIAGLGFFQPILNSWLDEQGTQVVRNASRLGEGEWRIFALGFLVFLFIGWVISIVSTFVKYYGFELSEKEGKLKRVYGLINHFENMLPIRRIQTVHIDQNLIQKKLKICKMYAATAGGMAVQSGQEGQGNAQLLAAPLLTPVLRDDKRSDLLRLTLPKYDLEHPDYQRVSMKTVLRHMRSGFWGALIVASGMTIGIRMLVDHAPEVARRAPLWQLQYGPTLVFCGFMGLSLFSGFLYHRFARWSESNRVIANRLGWLKVRWNYLPMAKIQLTEVTQNPAQRWLGLGTVTFFSAAPSFKNTEVDDVELSDAMALAYGTHREAGTTPDALFDGF